MNNNLQQLNESATVKLADEVRRRKGLGVNVIELQTGDPDFNTPKQVTDACLEAIAQVEMAARPGGGHIFGFIVEAVSGISMPVALVKILCGEQPDIIPKYNHGSTYRFFAPPQGIFKRVDNLKEAGNIDGVLELGFDMQPGTVVNAIAGDADRPGYMVTKAEDRNASIAVSDKVLQTLQFIMD
ncbi:unnamed protein product [Rotaria sordida]|uniref:L-amino acid ligase C-terminal domain-containing protein n=1 Tax=Rotaria sordida TaxID=392033 RepID=A0A813N2N6_9BILA|nr:unnamed protein product [Rotaria sordida]